MNDNWETQQYVYDWIQSQLPFKMILDLAASLKNYKGFCYISKEQNSLLLNWTVRLGNVIRNQSFSTNYEYGCWCNPPYSKPNLPAFTKKACLEAEKGLNQCFLVPLDITSWSRDYVWGQAEVWIPDERLAFIDSATDKPQTQPPKGSMIVIYGPLANKGLIKTVHISKVF